MLTITAHHARPARPAQRPHGNLGRHGRASAELHSRVSAETETDPLGHPWAPWADSTRASYPKGGNRRILDRHGDMLSSLNHRADATSVRIGFGTPYANWIAPRKQG